MTGGANPFTTYDGGTFTATLNGCSGSYNWGQSDTSSSIASGLASALNGSCGTLVSAAASGAGISLTSQSTGTGVNWPISVSTIHNSAFSSSSFAGAASGLSGGKAAITTYDSGTVTVSINGTNTSVSYSQGDSTSTVAQKLESALGSNSLVSVSLSGTTIDLTSKQKGSSTNYPLSASVSYNSSVFSQTSFTATPSGAALSGGSDANGTPVYDRGSVTLTINGTAETVNYGQNDTPATVASNLASAFSGNGQVAVSASGANLTMAAKSAGASTNYSFSSTETYDTGDGFTAPSFTVSPSSGALSGGTTDGVSNPAVIYSFNVPSGGYAANGDLLQVNDSVTGNWTYGYDSLNRLKTAASSSGYFSGLDLAWAYDNFGNRESQTASGSSGVSLTQPEPLTFSAGNNRADQFQYYANGDVRQDLQNTYLYDAEGRVCAVDSTLSGVTLYIYNASGTRVAKGSGSFSCNLSTNGFTVTHRYILDVAGRQMTEYDGSGNWLHSNVFANGELLATYSSTGSPMAFALNDWLGTKRVQAKADGEFDLSFVSLPYGDQMLSSTGATEQFFTGKERDSESGNDYFGARYYSSSMGRFMSPDWSAQPQAVPYVAMENPQSLNLYGYVLNNPLSRTDSDGHVWQCGQQTSGTNANGDTVVNANCHDVPDWWDFTGWAFTGFANILYGNPRQGVKEMAYGYGGAIATGVIGEGVSSLVGEVIDGMTVVSESGDTVVVQRVMSRAELEATEKTGLLRGGRAGTHFVTDSAPDSASAAQQQLALPNTPEVKVTMEVPKSALSAPEPVTSDFGQPGGGTQMTATGNVSVKIVSVKDLQP